MQLVLHTPCAKTKRKLMDFVTQVGLKSNYLLNKIDIRPRIKSVNLYSMHCDFSSFNFYFSIKKYIKNLSAARWMVFSPILHNIDKPNNWASWRCIRIVLAYCMKKITKRQLIRLFVSNIQPHIFPNMFVGWLISIGSGTAGVSHFNAYVLSITFSSYFPYVQDILANFSSKNARAIIFLWP